MSNTSSLCRSRILECMSEKVVYVGAGFYMSEKDSGTTVACAGEELYWLEKIINAERFFLGALGSLFLLSRTKLGSGNREYTHVCIRIHV